MPTALPILLQHNPSCPADFQTYVHTTTKPWERALLSHLNWKIPPFQVIAFIHQMKDTDSLLLVSDGSSFESKSMSFGLALGSASGTALVENQGPAFGRPSSHRAECTGCLSGALLLHHLQQFTKITNPVSSPVVAISDNQGMILSLTDRLTYKTVYPNATLQPDWDLLEEIANTFSRTSIASLTFRWVRGHQDTSSSSTPPPTLSPKALLNIRADSLAGKYHLLIDTKARPRTPLMTTTRCVLQMQGASVHANYSAAIRRAVAEPAYVAYLDRKHNWGNTGYRDVLWDPFHMAARTHHSSEVHLLKLVHDQLPTRSHLSRFQSWVVPTCHHCNEPDTLDHLQRGRCNPVSVRYSQDVQDALTTYFKKHRTPTAFRETFLFSIQQWLTDDTQLIVTSPQWHASTVLHHNQQNLGWRLLTRGFLSRHWLTYLHQCLHNDRWRNTHSDIVDFDPDLLGGRLSDKANQRPSDSQRDPKSSAPHPKNCYIKVPRSQSSLPEPTTIPQTIDPTIFFAGLIKTLWVELSTLWRSHLDLIHETAAKKPSPVTVTAIHTRVRTLVALQPSVLPIHRNTTYFPPDVEVFLQTSSLSQLNNYIDQYEPVIRSSIRRNTTGKATSTRVDNPVTGHRSHSIAVPPGSALPVSGNPQAQTEPARIPANNPEPSAAPLPPSHHPHPHQDSDSEESSTNSTASHHALEETQHRKNRGPRIPQPRGQEHNHHTLTR
jgi:hypothetical protein